MMMDRIVEILGKEGEALLNHQCNTVEKKDLSLPGPDFVDRVLRESDRSVNVLRNMQTLFNHGRLSGTGYLVFPQADIVKQKQPQNNGGYTAFGFGKTSDRVYQELTSDHPIDLTRYQVVNCYMGRAGLINSGGASGENDLAQAVRTAVINKRAGGMGLITGRKAFHRPFKDGVDLLNAVQDVYLNKDVTVA